MPMIIVIFLNFPGNRYYVVRYSTRGNVDHRILNTTDPIILINDLQPDTEYEFAVKVIAGSRQSAWSRSVINRTEVDRTAPPLAPPGDLNVIVLSSSSILVTWSDNSLGVDQTISGESPTFPSNNEQCCLPELIHSDILVLYYNLHI